MAVKAKEKEDLTIYQNKRKIEEEIENANRFAYLFQPFITELLKTELKVKPGIDMIRAWILSRSLDGFLKHEALLLDDSISKMKISTEKKLEMIDAEQVFSNYHQLKKLYAALPLKEYERIQINTYVLDDKGQLVLPQETIDEITDKYTVYAASKEEKEIYQKACIALEQFKTLREETGFDVSHYGTLKMGNGMLDNWMIDPYVFNQQMAAKRGK